MLVCKASAHCVAAALSRICVAGEGGTGREGDGGLDPRVSTAKGGGHCHLGPTGCGNPVAVVRGYHEGLGGSIDGDGLRAAVGTPDR